MNKPTPLKTAGRWTFHGAGDKTKQQELLQVVEGVDLLDALQEAANLVNMGATHAFEIGMGNGPELDDNFAWMAHHALQTAEAVIYSVMESLGTAQDEAKE